MAKNMEVYQFTLVTEFGYKTGLFSFQNNHKYLDLSNKMDLDFWDCFEWNPPPIL